MLKRVLLTITIISASIIVLGFIAFTIYYPNHLNKPTVIDASSTVNKTDEKTDILKDAVLLEKLSSDTSTGAEEKLLVLASKTEAVGYYAKLELAQRYLNQGKDPVPYYRQALDLYYTKDIQMKLALSLANQGSYHEAADLLGKLLPDAEALKQLLNLKLETSIIGDILLKNKQWQTASGYLKTELDITSNSSKKTVLEIKYAVSLAQMGNYKEALPILERLQSGELMNNDISWWYARCLEALNQIKKAKEVYSSLGDKGAYRLGILLENEGNLKEAAISFTKSSAADSIWRGAHLFDEVGVTSKALEAYITLSKTLGVYQDDAAYRAFVLIKRNSAKEDSELLAIISEHPSWMIRLNKQPVMPTFTKLTYDKPAFLSRVEAYNQSSRGSMGKIEQSIGEKNANLQDMLALGDWYLAKGDYSQSAKWGGKALNKEPAWHAYELAYPKPFNEQVQRSAKEYNVDPNLLWALIKQESSFNAVAVSGVGAIGLTQLMPSTAKDIASRLHIIINETDLLEPELNIRFGTYYLSSQLTKFSGDMDKALAAYNGGAGNVGKWSNSKIGVTKVDFPTAISFLETREYITKISNSYYIYEWLYGTK